MTTEQFLLHIKQNGWVKFDAMLDAEQLTDLNRALAKAYDTCRAIQLENGVNVNTDGTVHHLLGQDEAFLDFLKSGALQDHVKAFFGANYILNSYGGVINMKGKLAYVGNIHRDIRTFYNMPMMINMLVMLDDFTLENGATWALTGSHLKDEQPDSDFFYTNADRITGKAGDIVLFDSLLWHATGKNHTDFERRALTLTFTRPFQKQQLDYPRFLGYDRMMEFSEELRQIIGYNARVPSNLSEWYQPIETRYYKQGQG
ncbi:MAG: phytanoyl-CoA dioxygenase [Saprospiraceae bacterium]|nr:phytanoyl-CoA dioxygenase [Saprospiraceae bacterium]